MNLVCIEVEPVLGTKTDLICNVHLMPFPFYTSYEEVVFFPPVLYAFKDSLHQIFHKIHNDPCIYAVDRNGQFIWDGIC